MFGEEAVDWQLIETHWSDLLRTAISIRENRLSSLTLLRRLGNHFRKNRLYRAFRELGRAIRTVTLLRCLSEPGLREQITQVTNRNEAFHAFADWLMFGGKLIGHNDPDHEEKVVKFNELIADCVIYSTACDITDAANDIAAEGRPVDLDDLSHRLALHHEHRAPVRQLDARSDPAGSEPDHPTRPRTPCAVRDLIAGRHRWQGCNGTLCPPLERRSGVSPTGAVIMKCRTRHNECTVLSTVMRRFATAGGKRGQEGRPSGWWTQMLGST
ncbi:Tn3 transposase DDE domain-containing protein [Nonomuraea pusilla]|uniref:Tn3 transposase DDE domain-containing protein n=1 Tax=Nonomuraea pusilla TaxID=46177 RepID=A0A1H7JFG7_9ACTN|nr:Tn3 transposase DDE domain-containing protein [Nonomuraea pusilla]